MAITKHIYKIDCSVEDDRPWIDFELEENRRQDWGLVNVILDNCLAIDAPLPLEITVKALNACDWDFYCVPGTLGVISLRAHRSLAPHVDNHFGFVELRLNGSPYWFIKRAKPLDCLDSTRSITVPFPSNPARIMEIAMYRFRKEEILDPLLFCIPEDLSGVFGTDSVLEICSKLRGIRVRDTENP